MEREVRTDCRTAAAVGTFDGVHRGHALLLGALREEAAACGLMPLAVTFDRHPLEVVAPERAPRLITPPDVRDRLIARLGVNPLRIVFDSELRSMTAREWMRVLHGRHGVDMLMLGYDNRFGSDGRSLGADDFKRIGADEGIRVLDAPVLPECSSSLVRRALECGDMGEAAALLGRTFFIEGPVTHGREIGRTIGFPTANVEVSPRQLLPTAGVYAAEVVSGDSVHPAVVNIGCRPTVCGNGETTVEAHLPGFSGDLYGKHLRVNLIRRIREERKFADLDSLRRRIALDIEELSQN